MVLVPYRDHSLDTLLDPDLWLITKDPPSFFDIMPPHTTTIRNPEPRKHVGFPPQPTPRLRKRRENVAKRLREHDSSFFQSIFFSLGIDDLVQLIPDISRKVPEVNGLSIRDEKDLSGNPQWRSLRPGESGLGKGVEFGTNNRTRLMLERRIVEVLGDTTAFRGLLKYGTRRSCLRSGDTMVTRRESDRREIFIKCVCFFGRQRQGLKGVSFWARVNEFVRREKVGVGDVLDIGPVEKIGVVPDLEMRLSTVVNFIQPLHDLPVSRSVI